MSFPPPPAAQFRKSAPSGSPRRDGSLGKSAGAPPPLSDGRPASDRASRQMSPFKGSPKRPPTGVPPLPPSPMRGSPKQLSPPPRESGRPTTPLRGSPKRPHPALSQPHPTLSQPLSPLSGSGRPPSPRTPSRRLTKSPAMGGSMSVRPAVRPPMAPSGRQPSPQPQQWRAVQRVWVGATVERNPAYWERGDEDGGAGSRGIITELLRADGGHHVRIAWDGGAENAAPYRWGIEGAYDVSIVTPIAQRRSARRPRPENPPSAATLAGSTDTDSGARVFVRLRVDGPDGTQRLHYKMRRSTALRQLWDEAVAQLPDATPQGWELVWERGEGQQPVQLQLQLDCTPSSLGMPVGETAAQQLVMRRRWTQPQTQPQAPPPAEHQQPPWSLQSGRAPGSQAGGQSVSPAAGPLTSFSSSRPEPEPVPPPSSAQLPLRHESGHGRLAELERENRLLRAKLAMPSPADAALHAAQPAPYTALQPAPHTALHHPPPPPRASPLRAFRGLSPHRPRRASPVPPRQTEPHSPPSGQSWSAPAPPTLAPSAVDPADEERLAQSRLQKVFQVYADEPRQASEADRCATFLADCGLCGPDVPRESLRVILSRMVGAGVPPLDLPSFRAVLVHVGTVLFPHDGHPLHRVLAGLSPPHRGTGM
eukprot:TRINITY_DN15429_c0_g1_i1.p1 TRINITY_DN15429_c0_g1~~TRINITY_DN15429_c0_g1_i1.p1  ORF type:complete len:663 (+),score=130.83 TRINITY_DN15429_c0_g1_i1:45-1991(+)